jgi:hypothetical protein
MNTILRRLGCAIVLAIALAATSAAAQSSDGTASGDLNGSGQRQHPHRHGGANGQPAAQSADTSGAQTPLELDPGAVFCRTADDLHQHVAAIVARLDRSSRAVGEPAGCRVLLERTDITIVARDGPARTEVRMSKAPGDTGWTDAYLPQASGAP